MTYKVAIGIEGLTKVKGSAVYLLDENLRSSPRTSLGSKTIIFYADFVSYAASQLDQEPEKSFETLKRGWLNAARVLEDLVQKHRDQIILLNGDIAASELEAFSRFGVDASLSYHQNAWMLFALHFHENDDSIKRQEYILETLATQLSESREPTPLNLDGLKLEWISRKKSEEVQAQLSAEKKQNNLLLEQLFKVQEDLEKHILENKKQPQQENPASDGRKPRELRLKLESRTEERTGVSANYEKLLKENQDIEEESELILKQLFEVQEKLERYYFASKECEQQVEKLNVEIQRKNEKLHRFSQKNKQLETALDALRGYPEAVQKITKSPSVPKSIVGKVKRRIRPLPVKGLDPLQLIRQSPLFDEKYYLQQYPDVEQERCDPALHFLNYGGFECRNPGPRFNTEWYLKQNPDVEAGQMNPLVHYLKYGAAEGRLASPPRARKKSESKDNKP